MRAVIKALLAVTALCLAPVVHVAEPKPLSAYEGHDLSDAQLRDAVAYIEQKINLPEGSEPLDAYGRYYVQHKGIVHAVYTASFWSGRFSPGVHIVSNYDQLPRIMDGGCSVIEVTYIPSTKAIDSVCHGEA